MNKLTLGLLVLVHSSPAFAQESSVTPEQKSKWDAELAATNQVVIDRLNNRVDMLEETLERASIATPALVEMRKELRARGEHKVHDTDSETLLKRVETIKDILKTNRPSIYFRSFPSSESNFSKGFVWGLKAELSSIEDIAVVAYPHAFEDARSSGGDKEEKRLEKLKQILDEAQVPAQELLPLYSAEIYGHFEQGLANVASRLKKYDSTINIPALDFSNGSRDADAKQLDILEKIAKQKFPEIYARIHDKQLEALQIQIKYLIQKTNGINSSEQHREDEILGNVELQSTKPSSGDQLKNVDLRKDKK